jgi:hypothetical protein
MVDTAEGLRKAARRVFWEAKNIDNAAREAREEVILFVINFLKIQLSSEEETLRWLNELDHDDPDHDDPQESSEFTGRVSALRHALVSLYAHFGVFPTRPYDLHDKSNTVIDPKRACSLGDYIVTYKTMTAEWDETQKTSV